MIDQPFYDLPDVARKLGNCSRSTLYRLIDQKKLVRVRLGGKALITGESLAALVGELTTTPTPTSTLAAARHRRKQPDTAGNAAL